MVLGKLPVPGRPTIWIRVGQGPTALAVAAGGGLFGHFYCRLSFLFFLCTAFLTHYTQAKRHRDRVLERLGYGAEICRIGVVRARASPSNGWKTVFFT